MTPSISENARPPRRPRGLWLLLTLVVALAAGVRIYHLDQESIWSDEAVSIAMAELPFTELVARSASADVANFQAAGRQRALLDLGKPPLYFILLRAWVRAFGDSARAVRSLSVVLGTATVLVVFFIARQFMRESAAIMAAAFTALARIQIHYSQETRQYALLAFVSALAYLALLLFERRRSRGAATAYICAATLTVYTHSVGAFVIAAQTAYLILRAVVWRSDRGLALRLLGMQGVAGVLSLVWTLVAWRQYRALDTFWVPRPSLYSVYESLYDYLGSSLLLAGFALLAAVGFLTIRRLTTPSLSSLSDALESAAWEVRLAPLRGTLLLVTWLVVPVAALLVVSWVATPVYLTRATIAASLPLLILAARGIDHLPSATVRVGVASLLCLLMTREAASYYRETTRQAWRPVSEAIASRVRPGDLVLFHPGGGQRAFEYYVRRTDIRRVGFPVRRLVRGESLDQKDIAGLPEDVRRAGRIWLVLVNSADNGLLLKTLAHGRVVSWQERFPAIRVYLLEPSRAS